MDKQVVMVIRESSYDEVMEELKDVIEENKETLIIKTMPDDEFDNMIDLNYEKELVD